MNKNIILNGLKAGGQISFPLSFPEEKVLNSEFLTEQYRLLEEDAQQLHKEQYVPLSYQLFRLFWETGDRQEYEKVYFRRRRSLLVYAMLVWRQPEREVLVHKLEDCLWEICAEPVWSLPAHFLAQGDTALPLEKYRDHLDLFACETGLAITETLRMCGSAIAEKCRAFSELTVRDRILRPFLDNGNLFRFEVMENNWSAVCCGAIGSVAVLLVDDDEVLTNLLHRVLSGVEVYLDSFGEDGICVEGVDYFSYGFGFFVCFADYLKERTGGTIDYFKMERVKKIALGQQIFYLEEPFTLSFSDGSRKGRCRAGLTSFLKLQYAELRIPSRESVQDILEDSCSRFCLALRDILWYEEREEKGRKKAADEKTEEPLIRESCWLPAAQWMISYGKRMTLAAKGGHNNESHNHNDCGSFVLYKEGNEMLADLGAGLYDRDYFTDRRYTYFAASARSHSVPMIDGKEQRAGRDAAACRIKAELSQEERDSFEAGLENCYCVDGLKSFTRRIVHEKERGTVLIQDTFAADRPLLIEERFVSLSPFEIAGQNAVLNNNGVSLTISFGNEMKLHTAEESYLDHEGEQRTAFLLLGETIIKPGQPGSVIRIK